MSVACDHCALLVPKGLIEEGAELQFCCNGCRVAYEVIHEHETLTLTQADWEIFLDALDNPPKPNAKLRYAFAEHKKRVQR